MNKLIVLTAAAIAFFAIDSEAQVPKIDESAWMTVVSEKAEFSLRMPKSSLVHIDDTAQLPRTALYGFDESVSIRFARTKDPRAKKVIRSQILPVGEENTAVKLEIDDVELRTIIKSEGMFRLNISAASDLRFYRLSISGKSKDDPAVAYILSSIRIKGQPIFESKTRALPDNGSAIELSSLKTSREIADALKAKRPKWSGRVTYEPLAKYKKSETDETIRLPIELTVLKPKFNASPMLNGGTIRIKVVFKADGTVGDMAFYSDADRSILGAYRDWAQEIRFLPAIGIDGKPVDFTKVFHFTFSTSSQVVIL